MSDLFRAVIIDDEISSIKNMENLLKDHPEIRVVATESNAMKAMDVIRDFNPDLIFLDIQMPGKTGFEIVDEMFTEGYEPEVIFATAFDQYAIEAIRYAAFDYLVKPLKPSELASAIGRLTNKNNPQNNLGDQVKRLFEHNLNKGKIKFSTTGGFILINPVDILYILADWNYAEIYYDDDKHQIVTTNIGALETILPLKEFFRINRSTIINIGYLTKVSRKKRLAYLMKNDKEYTFKIPILNIRKLERFLEQ
jgi:two-component system LytT family response regulator